MNLSVCLITKNVEKEIQLALASISDIADEIIVSDEGSIDGTSAVAKKFGAIVYTDLDTNFGRRKANCIKRTKGKWILLMDSDEIISKELRQEIITIINDKSSFHSYFVPYRCHAWGRVLKEKGEVYSRIILFQKSHVSIVESDIHEKVIGKDMSGVLHGYVDHYSYKNILEVVRSFTMYAIRNSKLLFVQREKITLKKLTLFGPHMFIARYIFDGGYKDSWQGFILALLFSYMESLQYWVLLVRYVRMR